MGDRVRSFCVLIAALALFAMTTGPCLAGGISDSAVTRGELEELKARLERLESIVASQQRVIEEQKRVISQQEQMLAGAGQQESSEQEAERPWSDRIHMGGLIEVGGGWKNTKSQSSKHEEQSDITLATVELHVDAEITDWVSAEAVLLYEDALFGGDDHDNFDVDEAVLTIGNTDSFPLYLAAGKMYVPFGALLTHFPDDPLTDIPLTLLLGETSQKAVLVGFEKAGFSASAYVFNGDLEKGEEDHIDDYGFDIHYEGRFVPGGHITYARGEKYAHEAEGGFDYLVGFSYISNIGESDGLSEAIEDNLGGNEIHESVPGIDAYFHVEYMGVFLDAEYMAAIRTFEENELSYRGKGATPKVWNFEAGFNYNWWRNLEVVFKYAGSDKAPELPETRFGICFNQELYDNVIASLGYIHDEYEDYDPAGDPDEVLDKKDMIFWQLAVEF